MLTAMRSKRISRWNVPALGRAKKMMHRQMVLQILADRQIDDRLDAHLAQMRGRADAGQHQQLRRVEGAAGEDHLALGVDRDASPLSLTIFDAGRARALHHHAGRMRAGLDREIGAACAPA